MGGAVSSGRDNNELVDNLMSGNYIRSRAVERVFRVLDRADYMSPEARDQAYKDLAWRNGPLHLSAPCIYSEVMEALELKPGMSFLNVGSGTGYLSTLVGLIIGSAGTSHGVEALPVVFDYAAKMLSQFIENSITLDEFDFCMPKYYTGNGLCLAPTHTYDRVYCGAGVLTRHESYFKQFVKVGGVLVMPLADTLVQLRRVSAAHWTKRNLLNVSFALLRDPDQHEVDDPLKLDSQAPATLQVLSRGAIRGAMRAGLQRRSPALCEPPAPPPPAPRPGPRRICIPYDAPSDEELNELHDLDEAGGAHEMNALLSLVLSMGQNRAAGSLRLDPVDDDEFDDQYAEVGGLYALDEAREQPPLLPDDGVIVFDVAGGGMRARRWQPRPRPRPRARPPGKARARSAEPGPSDQGPSDQGTSDQGPSRPKPRRPARRLTGGAAFAYSSSEDEEPPQMKDSKRQKLDSGIGEGTASSGASPDKSAGKSSAEHSHSGKSDDDDDQDTDMPWYNDDDDLLSITSSSASPCTTHSHTDSDDEPGGDAPGDGGDAASGDVAGGDAVVVDAAVGGAPGGDAASGDTAGGDAAGEDAAGGEADNTGKLRRRELKRKRRKREREERRLARAPTRDCSFETMVHERWRARAGARAPCECPARGGGGGGGGGVGGEARRESLSRAMKRAVAELPLPHALKMYVNYGRGYQE